MIDLERLWTVQRDQVSRYEKRAVTGSYALYRETLRDVQRAYIAAVVRALARGADVHALAADRLYQRAEAALREGYRVYARRCGDKLEPIAREAVGDAVGTAAVIAQFRGDDRAAIVARLLPRVVSEIRAALQAFANGAWDDVARALALAAAAGANPRVTTKILTVTFGRDGVQAMTIARTETLRAYREATRVTYREAGVEEWEWRSARSRRTCAFCLAMDGKRFPVDEPLRSHPNCRCTMVPVVEGYRPPRGYQTAEDWLREQPAEIQDEILGPGRAKLFRDGMSLDGFIEPARPQTALDPTHRLVPLARLNK